MDSNTHNAAGRYAWKSSRFLALRRTAVFSQSNLFTLLRSFRRYGSLFNFEWISRVFQSNIRNVRKSMCFFLCFMANFGEADCSGQLAQGHMHFNLDGRHVQNHFCTRCNAFAQYTLHASPAFPFSRDPMLKSRPRAGGSNFRSCLLKKLPCGMELRE
jgi:hypothetical protein